MTEEMEIEASKLEKDEEDDFGTGQLAPVALGWFCPGSNISQHFLSGKFSKYQACLWDLMEKPDTSLAAKAVSFISFIFVVVSTGL